MPDISVIQARQLARQAAYENLHMFVSRPDEEMLRQDVVERENCWFFFRNPDIAIPPEGMLKGGWAYAVSRRGEVRQIADFSDDADKLSDFLRKMSDYFKKD